MAAVCINMRMCIRDEEPTGAECAVCGDKTFLNTSAIGVLLGPDDFLPVGTLCQSCSDGLKERCQDVLRQ